MAATNEPNSKKRKLIEPRSWVWSYFDIPLNTSPDVSDIQRVVHSYCSLCKLQVKIYNSSTSELIKHLRSHQVYENTPIESVMSIRTKINSSYDEGISDIEDDDSHSAESTEQISKANIVIPSHTRNSFASNGGNVISFWTLYKFD